MLKKCERVCLFKILNGFSGDKKLVSFSELYQTAGSAAGLDENAFRSVLSRLEDEEYIEVIRTDRHGEPFLYLRKRKRALEYKNQRKKTAEKLAVRLLFALLSALVTFVAGRILYAVFS